MQINQKNPIGLPLLHCISHHWEQDTTLQCRDFHYETISALTIRKMRKLLLPFASRYIESIDA